MRGKMWFALMMAIVMMMAGTGFVFKTYGDEKQQPVEKWQNDLTKIHQMITPAMGELMSDKDYIEYTRLLQQIEAYETGGDYKSAASLWRKLNKLLEEYLAEFENQMYYTNPEVVYSSVYNVADGQLYLSTDPEDYLNGDVIYTSGTEKNNQYKMFDMVKGTIPQRYMNMIKKFTPISDGKGGIGGMVSILDSDISDWIFIYDPDDLYDVYGDMDINAVNMLIVHEVGHLISFEGTQFNPAEKENTFLVPEGKLKKASYLNQFHKRFWADIPNMYIEPDESKWGNYNSYALYNDYPNYFVSEYAAVDPAEDFAESFVVYVLKNKTERTGLQSQKISFFDQYPELVQIREEIRQGLIQQGRLLP